MSYGKPDRMMSSPLRLNTYRLDLALGEKLSELTPHECKYSVDEVVATTFCPKAGRHLTMRHRFRLCDGVHLYVCECGNDLKPCPLLSMTPEHDR